MTLEPYNILTYYSGHEKEERRQERALAMFHRLVDAGYGTQASLQVIKTVFCVTLTRPLQ